MLATNLQHGYGVTQTGPCAMARRRSTMLNDRIHTRLTALMRQHQVDQTQLSRAAQQSRRDVNRFFTKAMVYPSLDFLDALARVFDQTLADLLAKDLRTSSLTGEEVSILAGWRSASEADRQIVRRLLASKSRRRKA
jgi:hypothetical protein